MLFNSLFISYAPDADKTVHRSTIKTEKYKPIAVTVKNLKEALEVCDELIKKEAIV